MKPQSLFWYQLKPGHPVPSPSELMGKILIKNKKSSAPQKKHHEAAPKTESAEHHAADPSHPPAEGHDAHHHGQHNTRDIR